MCNQQLPVPPTISSAAKSFIESAPPKELLPNDLTAIKSFRQELYENWRPLTEAFAKSLGCQWQDIQLAGHPVLEVTPKEYKPKTSEQALLYFYGGGFISGSPEEDLGIIAPLATHLGIQAFALRYPLSPEHPFPSAASAAIDVYSHLSTRYGAHNLAMAGESAGGNLVLATLSNAKVEGLAYPSSVALLSPWADLAATGDSVSVDLDPTINLDTMCGAGAEAYADGRDLTDPEISPLYGDFDDSFPPTLITTGTRDYLLSDCVRLAAKLRQAKVDVSLNLWEGMWHVFEYYPDIPEAAQSLEEIAAFLNKYFSKDKNP
ncbi:alpha/beta hydrolase [Alphaproteobacteria bacterium]|nr:alpha/beta hydrolase [Alphaproteobacteria bacterium]